MANFENDSYIDYSDSKAGYNSLYPKGFNFGADGIFLLILLGLIIAVRDNGAKWKHAVFNYYLNLFHHPLQIFHFETLIYILITLFFIRLGIIVLKKIF